LIFLKLIVFLPCINLKILNDLLIKIYNILALQLLILKLLVITLSRREKGMMVVKQGEENGYIRYQWIYINGYYDKG